MLSEKKRRGTRCNSVPRLFMFQISSGSLRYSCSCRSNFLVAIASISSITSFGRRATSTQLLAGYVPSKNVAYTSLIAAKSFISLINTVVFTTFAMLVPAASSRWDRFVSACFACATDPSGISPVAGTTGIIPEVYTMPFTSIAWEYGPIAAGALSVLITFFMLYSFFLIVCRFHLS